MENFVFHRAQTCPHFCIVFQKHLPRLIPTLMKKVLCLLVSLSLAAVLSAQGWARIVTGGGQDEARALARTPDGGYILAGTYGGGKAALVKTDADGFVQWNKTYLPGPDVFAVKSLVVLPDSSFVMAGFTNPFFGKSDVWLMKTDFAGNLVWQKTYGAPDDNDQASGLALLPNGDLAICGFTQPTNGKSDAWLARANTDGDTLWTRTFGLPNQGEEANAVIVAANGDLVVVGQNEDIPDLDVFAFRASAADGSLVWQNTYGFDFVPNTFSADAGNGVAEAPDGGLVVVGKTSLLGQQGGLLMKITAEGNSTPIWYKTFQNSSFSGVVPNSNGGYLLTGQKQLSLTNDDLYLAHVDESGEKIWDARIGQTAQDIGYAVVQAADGGAVAAGLAVQDILLGDSYFYLAKTTADGTLYSDYIEGNVFHDLNLNCQKDANEPGFRDWIVKIESTDFTRYASADGDGNYSVLVDTGLYTVSLILPNDYWQACLPSVTVPMFSFFDTATVNLGVTAAEPCPQNLVEVKTPILRRCAENTYTIRYCNAGTIPSLDTRIEVKLDSFLLFTGSSIPVQPGPDNLFVFNIGYLKNGDCGSFTFTAWLNCDSTITGQAHCVRAHIFPDTFCNPSPTWNGSVLQANGRCQSGVAQLSVRNTGSNPSPNTLEYIVIEDEIMRIGPTPIPVLPGGKDTILFSAQAEGKTYRIIAEQTPGYPGISYPTAAVEGCKTDTTTSLSTGYFIMFPEDDADAFVSSDCQESYEPDYNPTFLKRGHPKGYDQAHYISPTTDLDFLIRFVNASTDTVRQVVVRDTLSAWLDPTTVKPGTASHPYDFRLYGDGIVEFTIPNLFLLPGSGASDAASGGYVQFRVSQRPNLPCGTEIFNRAATYFDFNAPVLTNETFHTVCKYDSALVVKIHEIFIPSARVRVYPNPFDDSATFEVSGVEGARQYALEVYDIQGKSIVRQFFNQPTFRLFRHQIHGGLFFYRLSADGKPVASGKIEALAH